MPDLSDRIALVTGASRGAGAAIAAVLGEAGATVYVTGRSSRAGTRTEDMPGTVEDSAAQVSARGGTGIGVVCDHTDAAQVERAGRRASAPTTAASTCSSTTRGAATSSYDGAAFTAPFWEQPLQQRWDAMFGAGVWPTHADQPPRRAAAGRGRARGVHDRLGSAARTLGSAIYDAAKACIARFAFAMAHDLRERRVTAVAVAPGFMRTERVLAAHAGEPFDLSVDRVAGVPRARRSPTSPPIPTASRARASCSPPATWRASTDSPTSTARSPRRSRFPRDPQDRRHGDVPIASCQLVARPLQHEQLGAGDLARQRFTVREWEQRVLGAVDDERRQVDGCRGARASGRRPPSA